jgi:hypothetical protein
VTEDSKNDFTEEISEPCSEGSGVTIDDFVAYMPTHVYIFTPCREPWTQTSVNSRLPPVPVLDKRGRPKRVKGKVVTISPSRWLDQNKPRATVSGATRFCALAAVADNNIRLASGAIFTVGSTKASASLAGR